MKRILFLFNVLICGTLMAQEGSVGIGTQSPNENAVLHLVAPNNDQGLLIPKLTTVQRTNFSSQLTTAENGMMVYDSDLDQFFFWMTDHWEAVGLSLQAGTGVDITNGVINNTGDTDASDDFSGDWADLINVPAGFSDGVDEVDDADNDPTNELELPGTATSGQVLKFNGSSWVADTDETTDGDVDSSNELQDLNLTSNILTITGIGSPTQINLASYTGTNTDAQDLQFSSGQITLTGDPDNTTIDLSNYDSDVSDDFSGNWADLAGIPTVFSDGTDDVDDADNDPTNELEFPTDALFGQVMKVNDAGIWEPTDDEVNDADADITNEIQDLELSDGFLVLSGDDTPVSLSAYFDNTDLLAGITGSEGSVLKYTAGVWAAGTDNTADGDTSPTNEIELEAGNDLDGNKYREYQNGNYLKALNFLSTPMTADDSNISGGVLDISSFKFNKTLLFSPDPDKGSTIAEIKINNGISGQELIFVNTGARSISFQNNVTNSNLYLPDGGVQIGPGGTIYFMYVASEKGLKGWVIISFISSVESPGG